MKIQKNTMTLLMTIALSMSAVFAFTPPEDLQIEEALSDPSKISALIEGASPEESADVLRRVVIMLQGKNLNPQNKQLHVARFAAFFASTLGEDGAATMSQSFLNGAAGIENDLLKAAFVGFREGARALGSFALKNSLDEVAKGNEVASSALQDPTLAVGRTVIQILRSELGVPLGLANPVLSEQNAGIAVPLPQTEGTQPSAPPPAPPVAQPYAGQS